MMSKARSASITVMTTTTTLIGFIDREHDVPEGLPLVAAVDRGRLAQRRVDALQPGEVQHHDVADVPPGDGDQDGGEVLGHAVVLPNEIRNDWLPSQSIWFLCRAPKIVGSKPVARSSTSRSSR